MSTLLAGFPSVPLPLAFFASVSSALAWKGPLPLGFRCDGLSLTVAAVVVFVGLNVLRFAWTYLEGDAKRAQALAWMSATLASVLILVLSNHLLLLWCAWVATSLALHRLLLHFPQRPGAVFSARKKFVVSRLADVCLLCGLFLLHRHYGTLELDGLFQRVSAGDVSALGAPCLMFAFGAALKSAQFPFHSWLPDTMEAPTPVSALMHAGVINAGGFLILRLYPLFQHAPAALVVITVFGVVSAGFGALVMTTQPSVKRALAFSTVAQMGYLFLQCGLGAPGLALLHLVAHALYKAHAFLHSGSTLDAPPRAVIPLKTSAILSGLMVAGVLVAAKSYALQRVSPSVTFGEEIFNLGLALALAYGLARVGSTGLPRRVGLVAVGVAAGFTALSFSLHLATQPVFGFVHPAPVSRALALFALAAFIGVFVAQILLWRASRTAWGRTLYVHALNGFYISTYANRWLNSLWPRLALG